LPSLKKKAKHKKQNKTKQTKKNNNKQKTFLLGTASDGKVAIISFF